MPQSQSEKAVYTRAWRLRLKGLEPPVHGTPGAYFNYGCRCERCKAAKKLRDERYRLERYALRKHLAHLLQLIRERDFKAAVRFQQAYDTGHPGASDAPA